MFNKQKHQLIMNQILHDIYSDKEISSLLGFKGGTCAYYFYGLPRFSVDLDFDLLEFEEAIVNNLSAKIKMIAQRYGLVKEHYTKRWTLFTLLSYGESQRHIKIEINTRKYKEQIRDHFQMKPFMGISALIMKPEYMFATKLCALTDRKELATRDIFDIHYFASKQWDIDEATVHIRTGKNLKVQIQLCIETINQVSDNYLLSGLGELISDRQKNWVKSLLKKETIFLLENYLTVLK